MQTMNAKRTILLSSAEIQYSHSLTHQVYATHVVRASLGQDRLARRWATCIIPTASFAAPVAEHCVGKPSTMYMGRFTVRRITWSVTM